MNNYFYTQSLNIVAWLISKDFKIKETTKIDKGTLFCFERSESLNQAINDYNINIELKKFIGAFREVKKFINK